jgi:hypothetical protein
MDQESREIVRGEGYIHPITEVQQPVDSTIIMVNHPYPRRHMVEENATMSDEQYPSCSYSNANLTSFGLYPLEK